MDGGNEANSVRDLTLAPLAAALAPERGQSPANVKSQVCRWQARHKSFPRDVLQGVSYYAITEVRAWIASNVLAKAARRAVPPAAQTPVAAGVPAAAPPAPLSDEERAQLAVLRDPAAAPLDRTRAGFRLAAFRVAAAAENRSLQPSDLTEFKKAAEELRRAEEAYAELAVRRGELIELDAARAVVGEIAAALVACCDRLKVELPRAVEALLADSAFAGGTADYHRRHLQTTIENLSAEFRNLAAAKIEERLKEKEEK